MLHNFKHIKVDAEDSINSCETEYFVFYELA